MFWASIWALPRLVGQQSNTRSMKKTDRSRPAGSWALVLEFSTQGSTTLTGTARAYQGARPAGLRDSGDAKLIGAHGATRLCSTLPQKQGLTVLKQPLSHLKPSLTAQKHALSPPNQGLTDPTRRLSQPTQGQMAAFEPLSRWILALTSTGGRGGPPPKDLAHRPDIPRSTRISTATNRSWRLRWRR